MAGRPEPSIPSRDLSLGLWKELTLCWRDREMDPDNHGCLSNKMRLQPEQRQAFKQKPPESWLSGSLSPPHSAGTEATPDLTFLSAP